MKPPALGTGFVVGRAYPAGGGGVNALLPADRLTLTPAPPDFNPVRDLYNANVRGWRMAVRVIQSDLYRGLEDDAREAVDHFLELAKTTDLTGELLTAGGGA